MISRKSLKHYHYPSYFHINPRESLDDLGVFWCELGISLEGRLFLEK